MYNYSEVSYRAPAYYVEQKNPSTTFAWANKLKNWTNSKWSGTHQLLPTTENSPTISACTTATNLSSLDFQSNSTLFKKRMTTLEENLRIAEIEPLHTKDIEKEERSTLNEASYPEWTQLSNIQKLKLMMPQLIAAVAVSWVSMVIGYASAYTSPAGISMEEELNISKDEFSWICGLMPLGALGGGLLGGPMIEYLGRKWTLLVTDALFIVAWAINYFASHYSYMYVSRIISGCSVGIASLTLPVYLGETIQPEIRGTLGLLPTAFGNIGILLCFLLGTVLKWRGLAGVGAILPVPFIAVFIWFIPETPRWYISKGKQEDCHKALVWLRGKNQDIKKEFDELVKSQKETEDKNESIMELLSSSNLKPLMIVLGLMFFQQLSGINAVIFYTTKIFKESGSSLDSNLCTTIIGVVNFVSTFIAAVFIDRLGRKLLLYVSSLSMIITLAILGTYFYLLNVVEMNMSSYGWLPLASFIIYVLGFSLGFGPIPWLMMGEILPAKIRGSAASVATAFNWTCTFVVTKTFLLIIELIGSHGTFWLFGCVVLVGLLFTVLFVPETRGQSLEDIERKLAGVKVRRMSSAANLKPLPSSF